MDQAKLKSILKDMVVAMEKNDSWAVFMYGRIDSALEPAALVEEEQCNHIDCLDFEYFMPAGHKHKFDKEPSKTEKPYAERSIFDELDKNPRWNRLCTEFAPSGTFYDLHDDFLQSFIANLLEEQREELKQELIQKLKKLDISGSCYKYTGQCEHCERKATIEQVKEMFKSM